MVYEIPEDLKDKIDDISRKKKEIDEDTKRKEAEENKKYKERLQGFVKIGELLMPIFESWKKELDSKDSRDNLYVSRIELGSESGQFVFEIAFQMGLEEIYRISFMPNRKGGDFGLKVSYYQGKKLGTSTKCNTDYKEFAENHIKEYMTEVHKSINKEKHANA